MTDRLDQILDKLMTIESLAHGILTRQQISGAQVQVTGLDDISQNLGLVKAGEFRSGTGTPGIDFTGVRMGAPGWTYSGTKYSIVGLNNETLQFGLCNTDGKIYAGGGKVMLESTGIKIIGDTNNNINFYHLESGTANYAGSLYALWDGTGTGNNWITLSAVDATDTWANACVYLVATQGATNANIQIFGNSQIYHTASLHTLTGATYVDGNFWHKGANLGFYNHATTAQQVLPTGASKTVDEVITALQNLGLVKQS